FQDLKQGNFVTDEIEGFKNQGDMRMGRMFLPTMSDKSQMGALFAPVFNIREKNFLDMETFKLNQESKDVLYSQLVLPELTRTVNFHSNVKETNIANYDLGAQMFHLIPELNNIKDSKGRRLIHFIAKHPDQFNVNWFNDNYKEKAIEIL